MSSLSAEQLTALILTQCREIANAHLRQHQRAGEKSISPHFAIAVPVWWTKIQRSAMQDVRSLNIVFRCDRDSRISKCLFAPISQAVH